MIATWSCGRAQAWFRVAAGVEIHGDIPMNAVADSDFGAPGKRFDPEGLNEPCGRAVRQQAIDAGNVRALRFLKADAHDVFAPDVAVENLLQAGMVAKDDGLREQAREDSSSWRSSAAMPLRAFIASCLTATTTSTTPATTSAAVPPPSGGGRAGKTPAEDGTHGNARNSRSTVVR